MLLLVALWTKARRETETETERGRREERSKIKGQVFSHSTLFFLLSLRPFLRSTHQGTFASPSGSGSHGFVFRWMSRRHLVLAICRGGCGSRGEEHACERHGGQLLAAAKGPGRGLISSFCSSSSNVVILESFVHRTNSFLLFSSTCLL